MAISVIGALINVAVAALSVTYLRPFIHSEYLNSQVWVNIGALLGTAAALAWNFLGYKFLVFKE
jgi:putative flippase GtrA